MSKFEKRLIMALTVFSAVFSVALPANAMHIMEGYLPAVHCVAWGIMSLPFVAAGIIKMKHMVKDYRKALLILAMVGAYAFVLSALKFPSVTGSSSHPTGTGLGAIIFGPTPMAAIGLLVLLFQAILLAHGGLTTLGANTFSMAIAGPLLCFALYKICQKCKINKKTAVFSAAALGNLFTYCVTSLQLGIAYPSANGGVGASVVEFLGIFAITQVPLAIIEGMLTVVVFIGLETYAKQELTEIGFWKEEKAV